MSDDAAPSMDAILASIRQQVGSEATAATVSEPEAPAEPLPPPIAPRIGDLTLEALLRELLEPMLKAWLDANLPEIADRAAKAEIARLTGR